MNAPKQHGPPPDPFGPGYYALPAIVARAFREGNDPARYEWVRGCVECVAPERYYRVRNPRVTEHPHNGYALYRVSWHSSGAGGREHTFIAGPAGALAEARAHVRRLAAEHNAIAARPGGVA